MGNFLVLQLHFIKNSMEGPGETTYAVPFVYEVGPDKLQVSFFLEFPVIEPVRPAND